MPEKYHEILLVLCIARFLVPGLAGKLIPEFFDFLRTFTTFYSIHSHVQVCIRSPLFFDAIDKQDGASNDRRKDQ